MKTSRTKRRKTPIAALMLSTAIGLALPLQADTSTHKATEKQEVTQKESKLETTAGALAVTISYRGDTKILKKVTPPDKSQNTVFYVYLNDVEVLTYKVGPFGSEFRGAGLTRQFVKPGYTIKMAGDKEGRIQRITIYSPDFKKTYDGFWLKNKELIPWTAKELANWRKMRDKTSEPRNAPDKN